VEGSPRKLENCEAERNCSLAVLDEKVIKVAIAKGELKERDII